MCQTPTQVIGAKPQAPWAVPEAPMNLANMTTQRSGNFTGHVVKDNNLSEVYIEHADSAVGD